MWIFILECKEEEEGGFSRGKERGQSPSAQTPDGAAVGTLALQDHHGHRLGQA